MFETIIVGLLVALSVAYVGRSLYKVWKREKGCGCGCDCPSASKDCPAETRSSLEQLKKH